MRLPAALLTLAVLGLCLAPLATAASPGHYVPVVGDRFAYAETVTVSNGVGNYSGYTEQGDYTGSVAMTAVAPNDTVSATYQASGTYQNSNGEHYPWSEGGTFSFSATTFLYVQGTDNQTGYVNPYVWFFINNSLARGAPVNVLNSELTVVGTEVAFPMASSSTGYVASILAEGNGSYERDDAYGEFAAAYNWKEYFDPSTGYVLGYVYTETDSNSAGDGFTYTDALTDTQTSFPLTPTDGPPSSSSTTASTFPWLLVAVGVVVGLVVVVVVVAVIVSARRRHGRSNLPRHPTAAAGTLPSYAPPPPVNLIPRDQPLVQQVVVREVVKVPCAYCGTLIDSTATRCPNCGAART